MLALALLGLATMSIMLSARHQSQHPVLGVASQAFVISLPSRNIRRRDMYRLAKMMNARWDIVDATNTVDPAVARILSHVRRTREHALIDTRHSSYDKLSDEIDMPFQWPERIEDLAISDASIPAHGSDNWHSSPVEAPEDEHQMTCATKDFTLFPYSPDMPDWLILSAPRVACWQSHVSVIRRIVDEKAAGPFIILEDDVDMEKDTARRLRALWPLLPQDWDIVFLGHCWSNEAHHPPLHPELTPLFPLRQTHIHPSNGPKCTHAYAISRAGARRLLLHLRHIPFAYSRAIDQALSWLVASGRLNSFSVVPSVVVQRKTDGSDINKNTSKAWRDDLVDGCFART